MASGTLQNFGLPASDFVRTTGRFVDGVPARSGD
jgi:hypothetical protein